MGIVTDVDERAHLEFAVVGAIESEVKAIIAEFNHAERKLRSASARSKSLLARFENADVSIEQLLAPPYVTILKRLANVGEGP